MSFLHPVRLAFAGTFQADVSTVNNDVRHFDNEAFQPVFQQPQEPNTLNGWWNPEGSGAFRLIDCRVTAVSYGEGESTSDPAKDPVVGMWIGGSVQRTSGKMVDIDPQWQLASALWGLDVRLTTADGVDAVAGRYKPHAFRDLWFSRTTGQTQDGAASSTFQSVLRDMRWDDDLVSGSQFLEKLRGFQQGSDLLSIRLATFSYQGNMKDPRFTLGTVVGCIGPQLDKEPESFVAGRRFSPASGFSSWCGITYFTGSVDAGSKQMLLDLSNALQIVDRPGTPNDIGPMGVGILKDPKLSENTPVTPDNFELVAHIPYRDARWLQSNGGVFAASLTDDQLELAQSNPLALVVSGRFDPGATGVELSSEGIVAIRESDDGWYLCAEPAVHRIDAGGSSSFTVYARRYGAPAAGAAIHLRQVGKVSGQGGGDPNDSNPPQAPIPDIGVPEEALQLQPASATTSDEGNLEVRMTAAADGPGNPRGYIDGQIYLVDYRLPDQSNAARQPFDFVVVHARDAVPYVDRPTWADVQPILQQYANLYPIMSRRLIDLGNEQDVLRNRRLVALAFSLDIEDPNYMPVTRDLSEGNLAMLQRFLAGPAPEKAGQPEDKSAPRAAPTVPKQDVSWAGPAKSKLDFAEGFRKATKGRRGG
ncbi:MAG: hypothetical protein WD602_05715 [Actinomycetota bacterium]